MAINENKNRLEDDYSLSFTSSTAEQTLELGKRIGQILQPGDVVALIGDLGSGKTWMAKGIAFGLGIPEHEYVNSPAFDLIHEYQGSIPVYHMDFYRMDNLSQEDYAWLDEYIYGDGVCIIEWAEKFISALISEYLKIQLLYTDDPDVRKIVINGVGQRYRDIVTTLSRG